MGFGKISDVQIFRTSTNEIWAVVYLQDFGFGTHLGFSRFVPVHDQPHDYPLIEVKDFHKHIYRFRLPEPLPKGIHTFKFGLWSKLVDKYNLIDEKIIPLDLNSVTDIPLWELDIVEPPTTPTIPAPIVEPDVYDVSIQFNADMKPLASSIHSALGTVMSKGGYSLDTFVWENEGYVLNMQISQVGSITLALLLGLIGAAIIAVVGWVINTIIIQNANVTMAEQFFDDATDLITYINESPDLTPEQKQALIEAIIGKLELPVITNGAGEWMPSTKQVLLGLGAILLLTKL